MLSNDSEKMKIVDLKHDWQNKKILIVGAGSTGLSCANFLKRHGLDFVIVDSRQNLSGLHHGIDIIGGDFKAENFNVADILIVSPGVPLTEPFVQSAIKQGKEVIGDVELFCRLTEKPIIAITGSNGKSTVTTLVGEILNAVKFVAKVGGNIGVPCLDLLESDAETDCYVLELSSFQLETTLSLKSHASVILNLTEDHLDRYESFQGYCNAKKKILLNSENIIVNNDDEGVVKFCATHNTNKISFSIVGDKADFYIDIDTEEYSGHECVFHKGHAIVDISDIQLVGQHNKQNILAAVSLCSTFGINLKAISKVIASFTGLEHRSQRVSHYAGATWINDSKATNIAATCAALNGFSNNDIHLILGGQAKGQDFKELTPAITSNVKTIVIFGEDADLIRTGIEIDTTARIEMVDNLNESVEIVAQSLSFGDVVLFSPACASFDQFDNYMQRGQSFINAVKRLES